MPTRKEQSRQCFRIALAQAIASGLTKAKEGAQRAEGKRSKGERRLVPPDTDLLDCADARLAPLDAYRDRSDEAAK